MDRFLDIMRLNDDDDYEYDNEEYEDEEEDDYPSLFGKKNKKNESSAAARSRERKEERRIKEEPEERAKTVETPREKPQRNSTQNKITPINNRKSQGRQGKEDMEVCVIKPISVEEEREITETLLNGRAVVINMEGLDVEIAQRIIDFTSGSTFAIHGNLQKISNYVFIATPQNVDISGDFQAIVDSSL